jgi:hypothetical protein
MFQKPYEDMTNSLEEFEIHRKRPYTKEGDDRYGSLGIRIKIGMIEWM